MQYIVKLTNIFVEKHIKELNVMFFLLDCNQWINVQPDGMANELIYLSQSIRNHIFS